MLKINNKKLEDFKMLKIDNKKLEDFNYESNI